MTLNKKNLQAYILENIAKSVEARDYFSKKAKNTKAKRSDRASWYGLAYSYGSQIGVYVQLFETFFPDQSIKYNRGIQVVKVDKD